MKPQKSNPFKILALPCFIILPILLTLGCAYYNTFYNARNFYRQAERERLKSPEKEPSASILALYDKSIQKASKLLVLYPKSKWVDDSLLLLGKALYRKGEYSKAARKFSELEANYPQSRFVQQARYWRGLCLWRMQSYPEAAEILRTLAVKGGKFSTDALLAWAQMAIEQRHYSEALEVLQKAQQKVSSRKKLARIFYWRGESLLALQQYPEAIKWFRRAIETYPDPQIRFTAWFKIGQCLEESGQSQKALGLYKRLLKSGKYASHKAELSLQIAHCREALGDFSQALKDYQKVADDYPATHHSAVALYRMGIIYQSKLDSLQCAQQCFKKVEQQNRYPELVCLAQARAANIEKLEKYRTVQEASPEVLLHLAELYLFEFSRPDSALAEYQRILEQFPRSSLAPKACYAIGWIYKRCLQDTVCANQAFRELIQKYPVSTYAHAARRELGLEDPGKELFLQAERSRLAGAPPKIYLPRLKRLVEQYPESSYVPKAEYVIAWTYEYILGDSLLAHQVYENLARKFPDTQAGQVATKKLGLGKKNQQKPEIKSLPKDSPGTPDESRPGRREGLIEP
ncbi:MAG: hypothetical protein B1H40_00675 [Candidatus Latescibacteria bacterium 4484_181]|nr:MAG: hypothetical protein B1H40_00675 [Candidatus Latescibacteria bacterium 4484_181]